MRVILLFALFISSISIIINIANEDKFDQIPNEIKDKLATKVKIEYESYPEPEKKYEKNLVDSWFRTKIFSGFFVAETEAIENLSSDLLGIKKDLVDHFNSKSTETRFIESKEYAQHFLIATRGVYMNLNYTIGASHYENGRLYYYYIRINQLLSDSYNETIYKPIMIYDTYLKMNTIRLENEERVLRERRPKDKKMKMYLSLKEQIKTVYKKGEDLNYIQYYVKRDGFKGQNKEILKDMTRDVKLYFDTFHKSRMQEIVNKYKLNDIIKEQLNELVIATQSYRQINLFYQTSNQLGCYTEIYGIAIKENDIIFIAFADSYCQGTIVNIVLYDDNEKHCVLPSKRKSGTTYNCFVKQSAFINRQLVQCTLCCPYVPFEFISDEIAAMKEGLAKFSIRGIMNKLEEIETSQTYIHHGMEIPSNNYKYVAKIGDDGMIYVGEYSKKDSLFTQFLYRVGEQQTEQLKPYDILIADSGQLYIVDQNKNRMWSTKISNIQGEPPFKLILTDNGDLKVLDSKDQTVYNLRQ